MQSNFELQECPFQLAAALPLQVLHMYWLNFKALVKVLQSVIWQLF